MAELDKERRGASLIGELLIRFARRVGVPAKIAELEERAGASGIDNLLDEFEKVLDRRHREALPRNPSPAGAPAPVTSPLAAPRTVVTEPPAAVPPVVPPSPALAIPPVIVEIKEKSTLELRPPERGKPVMNGPASAPPKPVASAKEPAPAPPKPVVPAKVPEPAPPKPVVSAKVPEPPPPKPAPPPAEPVVASPKPRPPAQEPVASPKPAAPAEGPLIPAPENAGAGGRPTHPRPVHTLEADDVIYFHAVGQIPLDEKAAPQPFTLEEKGLEEKQFAFALDRGGVRFYLSNITGRGMNVSKNGVLLLSKQESMRLRGVHYAILNDLRAHGVVLPFTFGTVAMGKEALYSRIDDTMYDLRDALEEILSTKWWNLGVYALDQKMAGAVGTDTGAGSVREREKRVQGTRMPVAGRMDIKTLERLLGKQKKIAESIHNEVKEFAVRSEVDLIVGLNSGSSDDWKPILRASYEVPLSAVEQFNRAVIDLQYDHFQYDLMFVLNGDREEFTFS